MPDAISRIAFRLVLIAFACSIFACAQEPAPSIETQESSRSEFPAAAKILNSLEPEVPVTGQELWTLEERMKRYRVPALSLVVWHDYEVVWTAAIGLADVEAGKVATAETLFQAGSISKPVAAAAVLVAKQRGDIDLDAPINRLLKSWQLPDNELTQKSPVTPRRLLSHSAGTTVHGFPGYAVDAEVPSVVQVLDGSGSANTDPVRVDLEPGTRFRYSGGGSTIMQLAMMDLTGQAYPELLQSTVLGPLKMALSTYENPLPSSRLGEAAAGYRRDGKVVWGKRHTYPEMAAAGLWTTPTDLSRFAIDIQRALRGDIDTLLSQETAQEMVTPVERNSGLGFFEFSFDEARYFGHGGADEGFQALLVASKEDGHGAALMANSDYGSRLINEVLPAIARAQGWKGFITEPVEAAPVDSASLDALIGLYELQEQRVLSVFREGHFLMARPLLDVEASRLIPREDGTFTSQLDGSTLSFERSEGGEVLGLHHERWTEEGLRPRLEGEPPVVALLEAGDTEVAMERLKAEEASEASLNGLGYALLGHRRAEQAVAVFRLATELYPLSANAFDSLGDGYWSLGDSAATAEAFRGSLERLAADPALEQNDKLQYEKRANLMIARAERLLTSAQ